MPLPLSSTIFGGGIRENLDELKLKRFFVYYSNGMLLMMTSGLMFCDMIEYRGVGEGIVKSWAYSGILNFTFLIEVSSSDVWTTRSVDIGGASSEDYSP
ncbi:hypothetical protein Tco_0927727 [Tanacetum coccineum]